MIPKPKYLVVFGALALNLYAQGAQEAPAAVNFNILPLPASKPELGTHSFEELSDFCIPAIELKGG